MKSVFVSLFTSVLSMNLSWRHLSIAVLGGDVGMLWFAESRCKNMTMPLPSSMPAPGHLDGDLCCEAVHVAFDTVRPTSSPRPVQHEYSFFW